jgi:hypothetical protein
MTAEEIAWFDAYHTRVRDQLAQLLDQPTRTWLHNACAPLIKS